MKRSIWSGTVTFGMVSIPVKLYTATSAQDVKFNQLTAEGNRVKQVLVDAVTEQPVDKAQLKKGYEYTKGTYITIEPEELEALAPESTQTIAVTEFISLAEIDPMYFQQAYVLAPDKGGERPYALLLAAMAKSKRVGVAKLVLRSKEHLVALRPYGRAIALNTLFYADEVTNLDEIPGLPDAKATKEELDLAMVLMDAFGKDAFQPAAYEDTYRTAVLQLIEERAAGKTTTTAPARKAAPVKTDDLMAALAASVAATKKAA